LTLVVPGFTLGPLIRRLGLQQGPERLDKLREARSRVLHAAMEEIESQAAAEQISDDLAERLRSVYEARLDRIEQQSAGARDSGRRGDSQRLRRAVIAAERRRLGELRVERAYPADILREIGRDLDIEDARLR
jgi:CPA1 family monovalent cation:H+ antiporter